ncbi:hypothetical protein B7755_030980 [Streptomyces sp. NBS 14/10]|uniref:hypothetical protein n=1 Tax=Streptomyces sp. NBS 14/10 TaxID=1945643 RepID=UPI0015C6765B|nr:hypothetical protein [Streptomyces sp. NBS 14/10]KAK1182173.1 hypothetical protein B7755_030980 [Streptomyces sp. NBS 14/10]
MQSGLVVADDAAARIARDGRGDRQEKGERAVIVGLIVASEVGFWVVLLGGLCVRYVLRKPRAGAALLACVPLLDVVLLTATVIDLRRGAEPSTAHGLAAVYLGFSLAYGHYMINWADGRFAHRFAGGPPPVKPPKYGAARVRHEWRLWRMTLIAAVIAVAVLQMCIWLIGDGDRSEPMVAWQGQMLTVAGIHLLVAVGYTVLPPKEKKRAGEGDRGRPRSLTER